MTLAHFRMGGLILIGVSLVGAFTQRSTSASCSRVGIDASDQACTTSFDRCDSDHVYSARCDGSNCTCEIDGKVDSRHAASGCPATAEQTDKLCGWHLQ